MPPGLGKATAATQQTALPVEVVKQILGKETAERRVKVKAPGKFFTTLMAAEQAADYWGGEAVEFRERYNFPRHVKVWGAAGQFPGVCIICRSDAIDDPDYKGFWVTLALFNRWRHDTYKDDRKAENKQYLDKLPACVNASPKKKANAAAKDKPDPAAGDQESLHLHEHRHTHTVGGTGKDKGKVIAAHYWACNKPGCPKRPANLCKQTGSGTGQLFVHLASCQPVLCQQLRTASTHSAVQVDEDGNEYTIFSFQELLPHHVRYVGRRQVLPRLRPFR